MDTPIIDHRGPEFAKLAKNCLDGIKTIFKTTNPVIIYTATGTGAWEGALVNTLSPGDKVLMVETGQFATLWKKMAEKLGLKTEFITTDWRTGVDPAAVEAQLREDKKHEIKAVCVLHNETSTGCLSPIADVRKAIDTRQPSGAADGRHHLLARLDRLPPRRMGRRRHRRRRAEGPDAAARHVVQRDQRQGAGRQQDLQAAEVVLGLGRDADHEQDRLLPLHAGDADAARPRVSHRDAARGRPRQRVRAPRPPGRSDAPRGEGLGPRDDLPRPEVYSPTLTAVLLPDGHDADAFRALALEHFNISYGASFGRFTGKMFRIGHLGDINDTTLMGALAATEMALSLAGVPHKKGGVQAAMDYLVSAHGAAPSRRRSNPET